MKIYVVEMLSDYTIQIGFSTSRKVAEEMAKKFEKEDNRDYWVTEYTTGKDNWVEFDGS